MDTKSADIISLDERRSKATASLGADEAAKLPHAEWQDVSKAHRPTALMPPSKLYPLRPKGDFTLVKAREVVSEIKTLFDSALHSFTSGAFLEADDNVQKAFLMLPEAFCFRNFGEALELIPLSLFHGIQNRGGEPFDLAQLETICIVLFHLEKSPNMDYERALDFVERLEAVGLQTDNLDLLELPAVLDV